MKRRVETTITEGMGEEEMKEMGEEMWEEMEAVVSKTAEGEEEMRLMFLQEQAATGTARRSLKSFRWKKP